jgi:hypothetical protein
VRIDHHPDTAPPSHAATLALILAGIAALAVLARIA